jgi:hypothetical protein
VTINGECALVRLLMSKRKADEEGCCERRMNIGVAEEGSGRNYL